MSPLDVQARRSNIARRSATRRDPERHQAGGPDTLIESDSTARISSGRKQEPLASAASKIARLRPDARATLEIRTATSSGSITSRPAMRRSGNIDGVRWNINPFSLLCHSPGATTCVRASGQRSNPYRAAAVSQQAVTGKPSADQPHNLVSVRVPAPGSA